MKKTVCVIGLGYIGLPTAALLAKKGFFVSGVDTNKEVVKIVNQGEIHIVESGLSGVVKSAISSGRLKAFNQIQLSDVYMICVPTPFRDDGDIPQPNIDYILSATKSIAQFIKKDDLIILESTSPVGTTEKIYQTLLDCGTDLENVHIAYCPERVLPGKIMSELVENDRVVGGLTTRSSKEVAKFYYSFVEGEIFQTDAKTAEMCKLAENSFRDLNIAFANELSIICENKGINVWDLIKLTNKHPRVNILEPGTGVGGHCIAVDPWFIVSSDTKNTKLIKTAREVNNNKTKWVIDKIKNIADNYISNKGTEPKIACLGLTFKPNIDDLRESKALEVVNNLLDESYKIYAVDPNVKFHSKISLFNLSEAVKEADIICILVKHQEFLEFEFKKQIKNTITLDFCGALT